VEPTAGTVQTGYWYFSTAAAVDNESLWGDITLQAPTSPQLAVDPTSLDFGTASNSMTFEIWNGGVSTLNYTISSDAAWLTAAPTSGSSTGEHDTITPSVNRGSLASGTYNGTLTVNAGGGGTATVAVTMQVQAGTLSVSPAGGLSSSGLVGGPFSPSSLSYTVSNPGNSSINWTASKTQSWVTLSKTSGTLAAGGSDTVAVSINSGANALAAASYSDTVSFTNTTNHTGDTTRSVARSVNSSAAQPMATASRTSGVAPLAVFFDAVNTTSPAWTSGVVQPGDGDYTTYAYQWGFGDPASGTWLTGRSKNTATGFETAHVYENPGTYEVTLHVTDSTGNAHDYSQTITVTAFTGTTYYVSSSGGNDGNDGLSTSTPFYSLDKAWSKVGPNTRILFKRGDSWTATNGYHSSANGPVIIGDYGTGNKPKFTAAAGMGSAWVFSTGGVDWRFVNLDLAGNWNNPVLVTDGGPRDTLFANIDAYRP
jgi:hypothetical protein